MSLFIQFAIISLTEFVLVKLRGNDQQTREQLTLKEEIQQNPISLTSQKEPSQIERLQQQIKLIQFESESLNTPSTFAKYSKMQRNIVKLEKEIEKLQNQPNPAPEESYPLIQKPEEQKQSDIGFIVDKKIERLDIKNKSGIIKNLQILMPVIYYFIFRNIFSCDLKIQGSYFYPLNDFIGTQSEENENIFKIGQFIWLIMCVRIVSLFQTIVMKKKKIM